VSDPTDIAANETIRCIYRRHSVRLFTDQPVSAADLTAILEAANQAPSAHNQQAWRFIVLRQERARLGLAEMVRGRARDFSRASRALLRRAERSIASAPVIVAVTNTGELTRRGSELPEVYEEAGSDVFRLMEIQSSAAAVENLLLAATSLGIGSVWLGVLVLLKREVLEFLGEPAGELMAVVALGYPATRASGPKKLPLGPLVRYLD
jgi:nitroreductase